MKLSIQNRILIPVIGVVAAVMLVSTWISYNAVKNQLTDDYAQQLDTAADLMLKTVSSNTDFILTNMKSIALDPNLITLLEAVEDKKENIEQELNNANEALKAFKELYTQFPVLSMGSPKGDVIAGTNPATIGGTNISQRGYFHEAMQGKTVLSEPLVSSDTNDKGIIAATPIVCKDGEVIGVLYATVPAKDIIASTVAGVKFGASGFAFIMDPSYLVVAHPDYSQVQERSYKGSGWAEATFAKTKGSMEYTTDTGVIRLQSFRQDPLSRWMVVATMDKTEVQDAINEVRNINITSLVVGIILLTVVIFLIVRPLIGALNTGVFFAKAVADGDLDQDLAVRRSDEIGTLADALRVMVANLKKSIGAANQESLRAREESVKVQNAMEKAEEAEKEARSKTKRMIEAAEKLKDVANIVSSASAQLSAQIEQSERGASEQAARITETATAMEEMNSTVIEVARNAGSASSASVDTREKAETGAQIVQHAVSSIQQVQRQALQLKDDMTKLDESARSISQIMSVISDIADQTNLLALNAAIEAARAGDAGRGFAVVADEVRKLAEKTMSSTTDVGNAIRSIQQRAAASMGQVDASVKAIDEATAYANQSGAALQEIVSMVDNTSDQVRAIATAAEEQSSSSDEITRSLGTVNTIAAETARAMEEAAHAVGNLAEQAQALTRLVDDMKHQ